MPGREIRTITGDKSFGDTIFKRVTLRERVFAEIEKVKEVAAVLYYRGREDAEAVLSGLPLGEQVTVVHLYSNFGLADTAAFSVLLKKAEYMSSKLGEEYEGVISGVTGWGIYVELPNTVEGMVRLANLEGDRYEYDSENYRAVGRNSGREYRLGQKVTVQVAGADPLTRTIDFVIPRD